MATITCMRGYPGSGKSTVAKTLAEATGAVIVSRDTLRYQMFGKFHGVDECAVTEAETDCVVVALVAGRDVIVDAMHLDPAYLWKWVDVAKEHSAEFTVCDVPTDVDTCIARDAERVSAGKSVGEQVIRSAAKRWPQSGWSKVEGLGA
jgi:predicted kinase